MRDKNKTRKKGAQKKGGENSPISPPLDPRLLLIVGRLESLYINSMFRDVFIAVASFLGGKSCVRGAARVFLAGRIAYMREERVFFKPDDCNFPEADVYHLRIGNLFLLLSLLCQQTDAYPPIAKNYRQRRSQDDRGHARDNAMK